MTTDAAPFLHWLIAWLINSFGHIFSKQKILADSEIRDHLSFQFKSHRQTNTLTLFLLDCELPACRNYFHVYCGPTTTPFLSKSTDALRSSEKSYSIEGRACKSQKK